MSNHNTALKWLLSKMSPPSFDEDATPEERLQYIFTPYGEEYFEEIVTRLVNYQIVKTVTYYFPLGFGLVVSLFIRGFEESLIGGAFAALIAWASLKLGRELDERYG